MAQNDNNTKLWRSLDDLSNSPEFLARLDKEFPQGASQLEMREGMHRRKFLGLIGASMALAGVASTTGCIRRPKEHIYAENSRAENTLPGVPKHFATSACIASGVLGLMVTSTDGRPTKIDGNLAHPMNGGKDGQKGVGPSNAFAQAEILNLYDPDRGQHSLRKDVQVSKLDTLSAFYTAFTATQKNGGEGAAILFEASFSPAFYHLLTQVQEKYPKMMLVEFDSTYSQNRRLGLNALTQSSLDVSYQLSKANVILSVDSDFLGIEGDCVRNAGQFMAQRNLNANTANMNRLYCVESGFSLTGAAADHRYALANAQIGDFLASLSLELTRQGMALPFSLKPTSELPARLQKWTAALAKDLLQNKGKAAILIGDRHPAWAHALVCALNESLGALSAGIVQLQPQNGFAGSHDLPTFVQAVNKKGLQSVLIIGGNPVYNLPADLEFSSLLNKIPNSFYLAFQPDETATHVTHYLPQTHFLETWGDTRSSDGTHSICQPLIEPLFADCVNAYELVDHLLHEKPRTAYDIVRTYVASLPGYSQSFETLWRESLSSGVVRSTQSPQVPQKRDYNVIKNGYALKKSESLPAANNIHLEFALDRSVYDGRYANNAWLQETPDSIHKLVWDNALLISPKTAKELGLNGQPKPGTSEVDLVTVECKERKLEIPVWVVPGIADFTGVIQLGYGRSFGRVAEGAGFNANQIRTSQTWFEQAVKVTKTSQKYSLVSTQEHGSMSGTPGDAKDRTPPIRETTLEHFKRQPNFVHDDELLPVSEQKNHLFPFPVDVSQSKWARQQWGMSIDLSSCIGCNACSVACQAENNISVVGKEEVFRNREMSWIRVDRYFTGEVDDPEIRSIFQPINCQHCENAPCEAVCPVTATAHSPDGLNDMAYNRCVGTRYCANNCPYKVRRYNFFNYSKADDERNPLYAMQKNPNVTVRFRGVMEKCSYCVQRINKAKTIASISNTTGLIEDGKLVTACQSACPTGAIVFGDVADAKSMVSKRKSLPQNYSVLGELNTKPRTTYLARIRNVNPEIG